VERTSSEALNDVYKLEWKLTEQDREVIEKAIKEIDRLI
jgi:hypothetical protein